MIVLGLSALEPNATAALMVDGQLVACIQEARLTRQAYESNWPRWAIASCFEQADIDPADVDVVGFYEEPHSRFSRALASTLGGPFPQSCGPFVRTMRRWISERLWVRNLICAELDLPADRVQLLAHHRCHLMHALISAGVEEADVLVLDQHTEWNAVTGAHAVRSQGAAGDPLLTVRYPHSLGTAGIAMAMWAGLRPVEGVLRLSDISAHGEPRHQEKFETIIPATATGYSVLPGYFRMEQLETEPYGIPWTPRLLDLIGPPVDARESWRESGPDGLPLDVVDQRMADVIASFQAVVRSRVCHLAEVLQSKTGADTLVLTGPTAEDPTLIREVIDRGVYKDVHVPWSTGNTGAAIGAAAASMMSLDDNGGVQTLQSPYLGPKLDCSEELQMLEHLRPARWARYRRRGSPEISDSVLSHHDFSDNLTQLAEAAAGQLATGEPLAWCQGRVGYGQGPQLDRIILADPKVPGILQKMNREVTGRSVVELPWVLVLEDEADELMTKAEASRQAVRWGQCLFAVPPHLRKALGPAVNPQGRARAVVCTAAEQPALHALLSAWSGGTGNGVLLGWALCEYGQPVVTTPVDALVLFARAGLRAMVLDETLVTRNTQ